MLQTGDKITFHATLGDIKVNALMESFDLKPPYKVFATNTTFVATVDLSKVLGNPTDVAQYIFDKFKEALSKSFVLVCLELEGTEKNYRIRYADSNIKEISDGEKTYFI